MASQHIVLARLSLFFFGQDCEQLVGGFTHFALVLFWNYLEMVGDVIVDI